MVQENYLRKEEITPKGLVANCMVSEGPNGFATTRAPHWNGSSENSSQMSIHSRRYKMKTLRISEKRVIRSSGGSSL